jgi:hypothetical protein
LKKVRKFRYVQRLIPLNPKVECLDTLRFGEAFRMHYMGAVEFERGAFEAFLTRMHELNNPVDQRSFWQRRVLRKSAPGSCLHFIRATVEGTPIYAVYDTTRHTQAEVIEEITAIAKGRAHLKMPAGFPPSEIDQARGECPTVWAEIRENVIWSLSDLSYLGDWLRNTMPYLQSGSAKAR